MVRNKYYVWIIKVIQVRKCIGNIIFYAVITKQYYFSVQYVNRKVAVRYFFRAKMLSKDNLYNSLPEKKKWTLTINHLKIRH